MRQKLIDDLASAAWSVLNFDNDPGREPEGPANWKALTSAMERALEKHADRASEEINRIKEVLFLHEPASMEPVHKVVERICEDRKALAFVCENEVGVLRSLLDRPGGSDWARALTLLMPDLRGTIGRLLRVLVVTSTKRKE